MSDFLYPTDQGKMMKINMRADYNNYKYTINKDAIYGLSDFEFGPGTLFTSIPQTLDGKLVFMRRQKPNTIVYCWGFEIMAGFDWFGLRYVDFDSAIFYEKQEPVFKDFIEAMYGGRLKYKQRAGDQTLTAQ